MVDNLSTHTTDEVRAWLADNLPESPESTIVHGDYRLGNVMIGGGPPARVVAVVESLVQEQLLTRQQAIIISSSCSVVRNLV